MEDRIHGASPRRLGQGQWWRRTRTLQETRAGEVLREVITS
jgi:hypothetical protein